MGLDQYLNRVLYVGFNFEHVRKEPQNSGVKINVPGITFEKVSEITEQVLYWRKANEIHNWFVKNVQGGKDDCGEYRVSEEQLKSLLETVQKVLKNRKSAKTLLPTKDGFFFGGTDYDWLIEHKIIRLKRNDYDNKEEILIQQAEIRKWMFGVLDRKGAKKK